MWLGRGKRISLYKPLKSFALLLLFLLAASRQVQAQDKPDQGVKLRPAIDIKPGELSLTILEAVQSANKRYPSLARASAQTQLAGHEITVAKTQYLPRMDMLLQEGRASQNVTAGTILPQFLNVIPIQSGPPSNSSNFKSIFNSNDGMNFSWELIDFGRRAANVKVARRGVDKYRSAEHLTELDVSTRAADTYLKLVMANRQIAAYQAALARMKDWALVVHTLCDKGLRPGVDAARADAEVSFAKIALIEANKEADLYAQDLAEAIGMAGTSVRTVEGPLTTSPQRTISGSVPLLKGNESLQVLERSVLERHPLAVLRRADVDVSKARLHLLDRTWYPHLWLESAIWGRGSGNRQFVNPVADGIIPRTGNWAVALTLQFPIMDYFKVRAQKGVERSAIAAREAEYELAMQELIKQDGRAKVILNRAQETADETPVLVTAAVENETKARERYRVGLTNVIEVADAERILAKAQAEDAVSQARVWQAMLAVAYAHGDISPFLKLVSQAQSMQPEAGK